jgi:hypothetical protein
MPMTFEQHLSDYLQRWEEASSRGASHDQLRHLFTVFLGEAFPGIDLGDVELERYVTGLRVRGFIDFLYRHMILEFKRDLERERATGLEEIMRYLTLQDQPHRVIGILTDGRDFSVYRLNTDGNALEQTDSFRLDSRNPDAARLTLDCYLFAATALAPTAEDIIRRFGDRSPVFTMAVLGLERAYKQVETLPPVETKFTEWQNLLSHVYGSQIGGTSLFLRHTYLVLLTRVLAYAALRGRTPSGDELPGIIDGAAFLPFGIANLVEGDFFAWVLAQPAMPGALDILGGLAQHLRIYDFAALDEDVLKELYQHLIDPVTRHDLGEFYTPDWLAEWMLRESGLDENVTVLDPACGSGTFLFTAVKLLRERGLSGEQLVRTALTNLAGLDVHPVAVMIAKVNLILALRADLRGEAIAGLPPLPIFMANTLHMPPGGRDNHVVEIPAQVDGIEAPRPAFVPTSFSIPTEVTNSPGHLDRIIDRMDQLAHVADVDEARLVSSLSEYVSQQGYPDAAPFFAANLRLFRWLVRNDRNSIWSFVLRNAFRPAYFARRQFDLVIGNPPWLAYRDIARKDYQKQVMTLMRAYGLVTSGEVRLFTALDLSTVFFAHSVHHFTRPGGTVKFVMPRSVITGSRQHARFQKNSHFDRVLDLEGVDPLFNVPACVLTYTKEHTASDASSTELAVSGNTGGKPVPCVRLRGTLKRKNASYNEASTHLTDTLDVFTPIIPPTDRSPYHSEAFEGSTIVPRNMWFAAPPADAWVLDADRPQLETDGQVDQNAKRPWKGLRLTGSVEKRFLYATALGEDLLPFGLRGLRLVVVPWVREEKRVGDVLAVTGRVIDSREATERGFPGLAGWLRAAEHQWSSHKTGKERIATLSDRLDYDSNLIRQIPDRGYKVVYTRSGTHIAACVVNANEKPVVRGLQTSGFVVDQMMVSLSFDQADEAHYLASFLNARYVDGQIKPFQTKGSFGALSGGGERDITRLPFEIVMIPKYARQNERHVRLAEISLACHQAVSRIGVPISPIGRARQFVRQQLSKELDEIDTLVRHILNA